MKMTGEAPLRVAVCDDEKEMLRDTAGRVGKFFKNRQVPCSISCFTSGDALLGSVPDYDMLFLDIRMEGRNGMETALCLRQRGFQGLLIFLTVLEEYVFDAFAAEAFDYLLKPLDGSRLEAVLDRALDRLSAARSRTLLIRRSNTCRLLPFDEIAYCEAISRKVYIHTCSRETIDYYAKIETLEQQLGSAFFRCHRSYLLHLRYVERSEPGLARLTTGDSVPISRLRSRDFSLSLLQYLEGQGLTGTYSKGASQCPHSF